MAESSKIVPTLTENCFRQARHVHIKRVLRKDRRFPWQRGHSGPLGHLAAETVSRHTMGSEKYRMASIKPLLELSVSVSMIQAYAESLCESSDLLPNISVPSAACRV